MTDPASKVVVIGGGTGSFTVLRGLKDSTAELTALVSMTDDGGSTGTLRDELGVLPPGDVRQCLVALSDVSDELRNLFNYRFENGNLRGHSFGNLFLSAVEKMTSDFSEAVRIAGEVLHIKGRVIPITLEDVRLIVTLGNGSKVRGQHKIDISNLHINNVPPELSLDPKARINNDAKQAIAEADLVVIAPGDIYTSLGPLLIVDGVPDALRKTGAKIVYVCNLVTKPGQTNGFAVSDHAAEIERFAGGPVLDYVLYNTAKPEPDLFDKYKRENELPVKIDHSKLSKAHYKTIGKKLLAPGAAEKTAGDALAHTRSFIRHDSQKLAQALLAPLI